MLSKGDARLRSVEWALMKTPPCLLSCLLPCLPCPEADKEKPVLSEPGEAAASHLCAHRLSWVPWGLLIPQRFCWCLRAAVRLKCHTHCHIRQPGTQSRECVFSVPAWPSVGIRTRGDWCQPDGAKGRKRACLRWVIWPKQWPGVHLDGFGTQEREGATP